MHKWNITVLLWNETRSIGMTKHGSCLIGKSIFYLKFYKNTGKELCIVVTNVNYMEEEYFHPKTTPNVPIRMAVRMSTSIPGKDIHKIYQSFFWCYFIYFVMLKFCIINLYLGMTQPVHYTKSGCKCVYVDGGLLVNYPISCFDGKWNSDFFLRKITSAFMFIYFYMMWYNILH